MNSYIRLLRSKFYFCALYPFSCGLAKESTNVLVRYHTTTDYADSRMSSSKITFRDRFILRFLFRYDKFMAFD